MNTGQTKQYVEVAEGEVLASVESSKCIYCGNPKLKSDPFCKSDTIALPLYLRNWLTRGTGDPFFTENFRRALQHLTDIGPQRKVRHGRRGPWLFSTEDDLMAAGYKQLNHARCGVPGCGARVIWYYTPNKNRIAVNLEDYQPHWNTCTDPEYFARKREEKAAQTSAKKQARKRA